MVIAEARGFDGGWIEASRLGIGVGNAAGFVEAAAPLQFQYVVITGRVNDICHGFWTECLDRAPDLEPASIKLASPPKE